MKCCMPFCDISSESLLSNSKLKSKAITFHGFPSAPQLRESWLANLCMEECELPEDAVICSQHFKNDDFYCVKSGLRKLRIGAVPIETLLTQVEVQLTIQNVKEVNRVENKLTSDLVKHVSEPDYFGPHVINNLIDKIKHENSSDVENSDKDLCEAEDEKDARSENSIEISDTAFTYGFSDATTNSEKYVMLKYLGTHDDDNDIENILIITKNYKSIAVDAKNMNSYFEMSNDLQTNNDMLIARYEVNADCDDDNDMSIDKNELNPNYEISYDLKTNNDEFNDNDDDYHEVEYLNNCFEDEVEYLRDDLEDDLDALRTEIKLDVDEKKRIGNNKKIGNNKIGINKEIRNKKQITNNKESNGTNCAKGTEPVPKARRTPDVVHLKLLKTTTMSQEDAAAEQLSRKETRNYTESPFKCDKCYRGFKNEETYHSHMDKHTDKAGALECDVCKIHVTTKRQLYSHMRFYHMFKYSCTLCPYVHTDKSTAMMHERWHEGTKYTCKHCAAEFSKYTTYNNHMRLRHPADVCSHCGFAFANEKGLAFHMKMTHPSLDPTQKLEGPLCEECDVRFASEKAYSQHLKVVPKHVPPGTSFYNEASLRRRQGKYNMKTVVCEECGERITGYRNYCRHFRERHFGKRRDHTLEKAQRRAAAKPLRFMCEVCGKLFMSQAHLNYHMPLHSGQKQFACDVCDKRFMFRHNLMMHIEIHTEGKRYACELCGKQFTSKAGRWRHVRAIHHSVKYKCEFCDKTFTADYTRRNHIKHVHNGEPWPKRTRASRHATAARPETRARPGDTDSDSRPRTRARHRDTDSDSRLQARVRRGDTDSDSRPRKRARHRDTSSDSDSDTQ